MTFVGNLYHIQLSHIFQSIEVREKTGLLTITRGEQEARLYFQQGCLVSMSHLQEYRNDPLVNRLYQGEVSRGQFSAWARKEATESVQHLLSWSSGEVYFDEGVQPPTDQYLLALRITSLIPSFFGPVSHSNLSSSNSKPVKVQSSIPLSAPSTLFKTPGLFLEEEALPITPPPQVPITPQPLPAIRKPFIPTSAPSTLFKTPGLFLEEEALPITPPAVRAMPLPLLFKKSRPGVEEPSIPVTPLPQVPITPQPLPAIRKQLSPTIHLPQTFKPSAGLLSAARAILPLPDEGLTIKLSALGRRRHLLLRWEVLLIVAILLIAALAHCINMFHYPYYEDDEGTYMSQAWAVVHLGRLAYYTYWYDHAPAGWIQIAAWAIITGGFHTFGPAVNSGRVLMLLMQIGSTFMLYCIARSISHNVTVAIITSLLFALSPYSIYFHRRVLLDNIATFWMLLSILLLVSGRLSLKRTWLSALVLGISILSKEVTVFLFPVMTYLVFFRADKSHRWLAAIGWAVLVVSIVSLYPLMAILKNELFPSGTLLGGTAPHVSLLGTLQFQASRGKDGGFFDFNSGFWQQTKSWMHDYPILVVAGSLSAILSVLVIKKHRLVGIMGLLSLSLWAFLGRGGEVIGFYIVPLLPMLALNVGLILGLVAGSVKKHLAGYIGKKSTVSRIIAQGVITSCLVGIMISCLGPGIAAGSSSAIIGNNNNPFLLLWNGTQTDAQNQATQWIEKHLPPSSRMIIDESMWTDLYDSGYRFADYYWKAQEDPAIRDKIYHNDWRNFDYVVTTTQMLTDMKDQNMVLVEAAVEHSTLITSFDTGGWHSEIRKVNK